MGPRWRSLRSSEAETVSARGFSNFRRLFLRLRRRPSARRPEGMRGIPNRRARRWRPELSATQADRDIQRGNSALLRLAFLAAIVCAVLRAPTFGGVDRGGNEADPPEIIFGDQRRET